jgi:Predicted nucleotide kinase
VGAGKTSALRAASQRLDARGAKIAAILQPDIGRHPDGGGKGYDLELSTNASGSSLPARLPLAREEASREEVARDALRLGRFRFERAAFAAAESFARKAFIGPPSPEFLFIDEIGRLELDRREGLWPCLDLALASAAMSDGPSLLCSVRLDRSDILCRLSALRSLSPRILCLPRDAEDLSAILDSLTANDSR